MLDKSFAKWWLSRVVPFRDVAPEKLAAEREAMSQQQEYNRNYAEFLNQAVLPAVDAIVKTLAANKIVHRVSSWGNQLVAARAPGVAVGRAGDHAEPRGLRDLRAPHHHRRRKARRRLAPKTIPTPTTCATRCPATLAVQELQFFLGRLAQDLVEPEPEPEIPPGEKEPEE